MGLEWPSISTVNRALSEEDAEAITNALDAWAEHVEMGLKARGLPRHASPCFRPWNLIALQGSERVAIAFTALVGGVASVRWLSHEGPGPSADEITVAVEQQLGTPVLAAVAFPRRSLASPSTDGSIQQSAIAHVEAVDQASNLGRLGSLAGFEHLQAPLRAFLADHPDPAKNVFIMMRFLDSERMRSISNAIKGALAERGLHGVRADDRAYTEDLWTNIETYMLGSTYGIAVFEDMEQRDFNPNVSLELGFMIARRRRCLILKEQRLPNLPADVVHRLYKPFDQFQISESIHAQVLQWVNVDLGL